MNNNYKPQKTELKQKVIMSEFVGGRYQTPEEVRQEAKDWIDMNFDKVNIYDVHQNTLGEKLVITLDYRIKDFLR